MKKNIDKKKTHPEDSKEKLKRCEEMKNEYLAGWQRAKADFLNYKKDEAERIGEILKFSAEEMILGILPILDSFNLAEKGLSKELKKDEHIKGILQIKKQFEEVLKRQGVEEIKTRKEKFDPNFHEAVEGIEKKGFEKGVIIEEIQKGYILNNKVIRPARVKVSK